MKITLLLIFFVVSILLSCKSDNIYPKVISTIPVNGDMEVDTLFSILTVTFSEPMMDKSWSWVYTKQEAFPEMTGEPKYENNFTKNVLPVKLEPNKEYEVWINSNKFNNFKDKSGNSSAPYKLVFKTK